MADGTAHSVDQEQELTLRERRVAALLALGYTDAKISKNLGMVPGLPTTAEVGAEIKSACTKLGVKRHGLVLWFVDNLKDDDRVRMVAAAERRRDQLRASGVLNPVRVRLAMMLADPATCDLTQGQLGQQLEPRMIAAKVGAHLRTMYMNIGPDGCSFKLAAIMRLAPLSDRTTTDDGPEDTETL